LYVFNFEPVFAGFDQLLLGAWLTIQLSVASMILGLIVSVICAAGKTSGVAPLRWVINAYIEIIRNTPFLVQIFFIFFGLPSLGVQISEWQAAVLAMVINLGAYSTEIIRAGIQAIPRGQLEAAAALAMSRFEAFRHVVLLPALGKVWPALSSQIIIVMLGSAVCSQIATEELSFAANFIQSRNFRAFETYALTTLIYLCMALLIRQLLNWIGRRYISRSRA